MILVTHNIGSEAMAKRDTGTSERNCQDYGETKNVLDNSQDPYTQVDEFGASFEERTYYKFLVRNDFG